MNVHRMKTLFCDECIGIMFNNVQGKLVEKFVIIDIVKKLQ